MQKEEEISPEKRSKGKTIWSQMAVSTINNWPVMMWPVRAVPFISSGVTYSPRVCPSSSTSHPLSGSIHTALHHSDGPANHRDQWLGLDLPKWSYPGLHRHRPPLFPTATAVQTLPPSLPVPPASLPLSIRLASMHIHQLSRASWPAKRARPCTHTHTQTCGEWWGGRQAR